MDATLPASRDVQSYCQLFKERIPTLQELTSSKIARSLWYNTFFGGNVDGNENELGDCLNCAYRNEVEQSSQFLRNYIPHHLIPRLLRFSVFKVQNEINCWMFYNKKKTLPDHQMSIFRDHLKCLVWRFDGRIDHIQTARKMLALDSLSQVDKFAIMCRYCLEDEFEKFAVNEELEKVLVKAISQRRSRLAFYWICKLKKDLRGVQFGANFESLESFMVTKMTVRDRYASVYFWNCLSEQDQVDKAVLLLNRWTCFEHFQKRLLSKMNEFQLSQIFSLIPVKIVKIYWNSYGLEQAEMAFTIWTRIKHLISGEQFDELLHTVLAIVTHFTDERLYLVIRVWETADDHQKKFILDQDKYFIIDRYFLPYPLYLSKKLQFLYAMLSYSSPSYRKEFILEQGVRLLVKYHGSDVPLNSLTRSGDIYSEADRVLKFCLPNESDIIEFRKLMMKSSEAIDLCTSRFRAGCFENVNEFVNFYAPDVSAMSDFKKLILDSSKFVTKHIFLDGNWTKVEKFVDEAYLDASLAKNMKQQLILTSGTHGLFDSMNADSLRSLINISAEFLTNEEIVTMKESLLNQFRGRLMEWYFWKSSDETYWREFASFCFEGEEKINEFKSTIPIDEIFGQKLATMISKQVVGINFIVEMVSVMDNFLTWYLVEPEEVKKYKLRRIFEFNDSAIIETLIAKTGKKNVKTLLVWFLNNDEEQISKFKTEFSDKDVSQLI